MWLYGLLGLSLCILTATRFALWVERRLHGSEGTYGTVKSLTALLGLLMVLVPAINFGRRGPPGANDL